MSKIFLPQGQGAKFKNPSFLFYSAFNYQHQHILSSPYRGISGQRSSLPFSAPNKIIPLWQMPKTMGKKFSEWDTSCTTAFSSANSSFLQTPKRQLHLDSQKKVPEQQSEKNTETKSTKGIVSFLAEQIGRNGLFKSLFPVEEKSENAFDALKNSQFKLNPKTLEDESEPLYQSAKDLMKEGNFTKEQNQSLSPVKQNLSMPHDALKMSHEQNDLFKEMVKNLSHLNEQTKELRKENHQQRDASKEANVQALNELDKKMEDAEKSRFAQLGKLEELVKNLEKLLQKQDESANSRLTLGVAYSSILSLLFAMLAFYIQQSQMSEKEKEEKRAQADRARIEAEELTKKIEKLQLKYSGLINQKLAIEENIKNLQESQEDLIKMKPRFYTNTTLELGIKQLNAKIGQEKIEHKKVLSAIRRLELYVKHQQEEEQNKLASQEPQEPQETESKDRDENSPPVFRP